MRMFKHVGAVALLGVVICCVSASDAQGWWSDCVKPRLARLWTSGSERRGGGVGSGEAPSNPVPSKSNAKRDDPGTSGTSAMDPNAPSSCPEEWVRVSGGQVKVKRTPSDGDSLFASVGDQLALVRGKRPDKFPSIRKLRKDVAAFLEKNRADEVVVSSILQTAWLDYELIASVRRESSASAAGEEESPNKRLIDAFIQGIANGRCWGGSESIYALSQLFGVTIRVYNEGERSFKFGELEEELKICARQSYGERIHYDSVIEVRLTNTQGVGQGEGEEPRESKIRNPKPAAAPVSQTSPGQSRTIPRKYEPLLDDDVEYDYSRLYP